MVQDARPQSGELIRTTRVVTPESVPLEFELAGPGSRFAAVLLDTLCQLGVLALLAAVGLLPLVLARGWSGAVAALTVRYVWPVVLFLAWLVIWGWFAAFEAFGHGQSPGKRALRLRVIRDGGYPLDGGAALLRNLLRTVDLLPLVAPYLLGGMVMFWHSRYQRIGDQVAGTLVIRERRTPWLEALLSGASEASSTELPRLTARQIERLRPDEAVLIGSFLRRRESLPLPVRRSLAERLANPLRERLESPRAVPASADADEVWLEAVWSGWQTRRGGA